MPELFLSEHRNKIPIDHPDNSIITSKIVNEAITTEKIKDLNVTVEKLENILDLQPKSVYVHTPEGTNIQSEYPNTEGDLLNTYTRAVIDSKLSNKSDVGHTHLKSQITDFPESIKNPEKLTINGQEYDGSAPLSITTLTEDFINPFLDGFNEQLFSLFEERANSVENAFKTLEGILDGKSSIIHSHSTDDIVNFPDVYTKTEANNLIEELQNKINDLEERIIELENGGN